jgi:AraC-like DNA-binding protein
LEEVAERLYVRLAGDSAHGPESSAPPGTLCAAPVPMPLRRYVSGILAYREDLSGDEVFERVLPDGAVRLVFNLGEVPSAANPKGNRVEAVGASAAPALVRLSGRMDGVTITLRAGAASALLGIPAGELTESAVHLDALWGGEGVRVLDRLASAPDDQTRVQVLQAALLARLSRHESVVHPAALRAAQLFAESGGQLTVAAVAGVVGVGERRLQQLFHAHVGLAPRAYRRLARLHACLRALRRTPHPGWAQLASEAGYYDQAHLANEFRALSGLSPSAFLEHAVSGSSKKAG